MLKLVALVRTERGGNVETIKRKAESKNAFRKDLKGNGYRIIALMTKEEAMEIKKAKFEEYLVSKFTNLSAKEQTLIYDTIKQAI